MKSQHSRQAQSLVDGERVVVAPGQWLTSRRRLQADVAYTSPKSVLADLALLEAAGVIQTEAIRRQRVRNGTGGGSPLEPGGRFQNGTAVSMLATRITVHGVNQLREQGGSKLEPRSNTGTSSLSAAEVTENQRAIAQLKAEGRWSEPAA